MTDVVVDTDVVSFGFRASPEFAFYEPHLAGVTAFMTFAEIQYGMRLRNWGQRRRDLMDRYLT